MLEGGQLVITQDNCGTYANEITETFGIAFGDGCFSYINEFASYPRTAGLTEVTGITVRKIIVSGSSEEIGWYDGCCCANDLSPGS